MAVDNEQIACPKCLESLLVSWGHGITNKTSALRDKADSIESQLRNPSLSNLNKISAAANDIRRIAEELEHLSSPFQTEKVSVNALIRNRLEIWEKDAPYKSMRFDLKLCPDEPTVWASSSWLRRLLDSLVDNAIAAMEESATKQIMISTEVDEQRVVVSVRDTGKGNTNWPAPSVKPPVTPSGRGRGLYIASQLVDIYGGAIKVSDSSPAGTTMVFWLPLINTL